MVAMLMGGVWQRFARVMAVGSLGLVVVACGGNSKSDDDDDDNGSGATGGSGKGGTTGTGGGSGKGGVRGGTSGGTGGDSGLGGTSGASNAAVALLRATAPDKVDLLLMIDNSLSMADKQQLLAQSLPTLMARLSTPRCIGADGNPSGGNADGMGHCADGAPEFAPVRDLHLGIITTSLGDHGSGDVCSAAQNQENIAQGLRASNYDDHAQLMPTVRTSEPTPLVSWNNTGFLVWDPRDQSAVLDPHANLTETETNPNAFINAAQNQVVAAGERGCGYEASLESWYRFLVDPEPVQSMSNTSDTALSVRGPVNQVVLQQREAFLRPDSALVVLMMSDENDCSIQDEDGGQGWLVGYKGGINALNWHMPRATSACAADPNDKCCQPCSASAFAGCPTSDADPACSMGQALSVTEDSMNLRCFHQVQRFGIDLLYPVSRYVEALTSSSVTPRLGGGPTENPLFANRANGAPHRQPGSVILAGILGVPWQDLATEDSWQGRDLTYLDAGELADAGRWDVVLGDPSASVLPTDTLMVESIDPRTSGYPQAHPLIDATIGSSAATTLVNPINGHELQPTAVRSELQYACIFELPTPVACTDANADGCDCNYDDYASNPPQCEGVSATVDGTQTHGKAYPSVRELQVLKGIGANAVVASICAKNVDPDGTPDADPAYGYNPAITLLVAKLKEQLAATSCLPRQLALDPNDPSRVACHVFEGSAFAGSAADCSCSAPGHAAPTDTERTTIVNALRQLGACLGSTCDEACVCEVEQLSGDALAACQAGDADTGESYGFCYVDPAQGAGSDAAVASCSESEKRTLRFMGEGVPSRSALTFLACGG